MFFGLRVPPRPSADPTPPLRLPLLENPGRMSFCALPPGVFALKSSGTACCHFFPSPLPWFKRLCRFFFFLSLCQMQGFSSTPKGLLFPMKTWFRRTFHFLLLIGGSLKGPFWNTMSSLIFLSLYYLLVSFFLFFFFLTKRPLPQLFFLAKASKSLHFSFFSLGSPADASGSLDYYFFF